MALPVPVDPAGARPGHRPQPHRLQRPPHELRPRRQAHRAARRLLRGAGRGRRRADHHRGALDPSDRLAVREADPRLPPRGDPRLPARSPTPCTATACRSSPRSTTTAARRRSMYSRLPVWAPSAVADPLFREVPKAVTHAEIDEIVAGYAHGRRALRRGRVRRHRAAVLALARSCAGSCRRPPTSAPTSTAARSSNRARLLVEIVGRRAPGDRRPRSRSACASAATS